MHKIINGGKLEDATLWDLYVGMAMMALIQKGEDSYETCANKALFYATELTDTRQQFIFTDDEADEDWPLCPPTSAEGSSLHE